MAVPLRKLHLPRRTFLKGAGASLALPWLDAMLPAGAPTPRLPVRALFVFAPNGKKMDEWTPATAGADFALPPILAPLAPVREWVSVLSGLDLDGARSHGDGPGDHARACAAFLTCAHPRKTGGADIHVGRSIDQVIAGELGASTSFPSLEVAMERGRRAGSCDSGYACAYSHNLSWRTPSTPVAPEISPRALFARLFGDPGRRDAAAAERQRRDLRSVLDVVRADVRDLERRLSTADRSKLDEYLTAVRELEVRLQRDEAATTARPGVAAPKDLEARAFPQRLDLMYELIALAFEMDVTRVATFMVGHAGSNRSYPFLGVPEGHHGLSHHRGSGEKHAKIGKINRFHVERFSRFLSRLATTGEAGASLLDQAMIVYGSGISDGNRHNHGQLPILLAGRGGGALRPGRHVVCDKGTPLANLYLSLLHRLDLGAERFGDSTGTLAALDA